MATGFILVLAGAFLVLRTIVRNDEGHNLVDLLLGLNGNGS